MSNDIYPLLAEPNLDTHRGFILAEEEALKDHLTGITVPAVPAKAPPDPRVKVGVWFRFPEGERQIKYPFITIDLLSAEPAFELFHSDYWEDTTDLYRPSVSPHLPPPPFGHARWAVKNFLPFRLTFQVSHFARSNLHDRYLTSIFMTDVFPVRPFFIVSAADNVYRRTELLGMNASNVPETTESGTKRIFRKFYTVSMLTEIPQTRFTENDLFYETLRVLIPVVHREDFDTYYETFIHEQPDPMNDFTQEERNEGGELFSVAHEGKNIPTAGEPPP